MSSSPNSFISSAEAIVILVPTIASLTSAVIVTVSGISMSISRSFRFRSFASPGNATPTTIFLSPSEISFPFSTDTLLYSSEESIIALTMVNGVYISTSSPFTLTVCFDLLS